MISVSIHGLALLALAQLPQADSAAQPQLDSAWCVALTAELPDTVAADTVPVWVLVDRWGRVDSARVDSSATLEESRERRLLREARKLRFLPWEEGPGWALVGYPVPAPDSVAADTAEPEPTGPTTKPEIKNRRRAADTIFRRYPKHLQDAGVDGTTTVMVFVDSTGAVENVETRESSGTRELDEAAERAVYEIEFTPALNQGRPVAVWATFPVMFDVPGGNARPPPPQQFNLGPDYDPVAEATLTDPDELDALPELIHPDRARERLSRVYLDSGAAEDLGLLVTLRVGADGAVQSRRITERLGGAARQEGTVTAIYTELGRLRFRPGIASGEPQRTRFSVRLVFGRDVGLAPSPRLRRTSPVPFFDSSGCAGADSVLTSGPRYSNRDEDPRLVTPEWEQARVISDTWPIALQMRHESYEFQFWLLVDTTGGVCKAEVVDEPDDPWVAGKTRHIARRFRFEPARLDGQPVAAWHNYALAFSFVSE